MRQVVKSVESIIDQAKRVATVEPDDYTVDGLVYCGACKTPKQCVVNLFGVWRTVPCACQCMIKRMELDKADMEQRRGEDHIKRLRSQGLQERYMSAWTFANDEGLNPSLISKAQRYYKAWDTVLKDNNGLLLWGGVGTGKSYSAACIANALIDDGVPVLMTNMAKLINALSGFDIEDKNTYIASLDNYKLLIIDDLGIEANTDFRFELVFNIIEPIQERIAFDSHNQFNGQRDAKVRRHPQAACL